MHLAGVCELVLIVDAALGHRDFLDDLLLQNLNLLGEVAVMILGAILSIYDLTLENALLHAYPSKLEDPKILEDTIFSQQFRQNTVPTILGRG